MPPLSGWSNVRKVTGDGSLIVGGPHTGLLLPIHISADPEIRASMASDGRDVRITDTSNNLKPFFLQANGHVIFTDGVWSFFNGPNAIYSATYDKTWVTAHGATGYGKIAEIDHATNTITALTSLGNSTSPAKDDHNNGGIVLTSTGKLLVAYTGHADTTLRIRISTSAGSAAAFDAEDNGGDLDPVPTATQYSYDNLVRLSSEGTVGRIYLIYRFEDPSAKGWGFITSDDDGLTWSAHTHIWQNIASGLPYMRVDDNGVDRIDFLVTDVHPNDTSGGNRYVGHFYYQGGTFRGTNGTALGGSAPYDKNDVTTVFDGTDFGGVGIHARAWIWGVAYDGTNPHALFTVFPNNDGTDHRYYYRRWDGAAWATPVDITGANTGTALYAAEAYYSGGVCFDPDDLTSIFLCQRVSGVFELQRWTTADNGATWSKAEDLTSGSAAPNFRPFCTKGSTGKRCRTFICACGEYNTYVDYHTVIRPFPALDHEAAIAWVLDDGLTNGVNPEYLVHTGNPAATDGQDVATALAAYSMFSFGVVQPKQVNSNIAQKGTLNVQDRALGELWLEAPGGYGQRINLDHSQTTNRATGDIINMAGWSGVTAEGWFRCDTTTTSAQVFMDLWTGASNAGILWRKKASATAPQAYVSIEPNTQVGGDMTGVTVPDDTPFYGVMAGRQSGGWSHWVRHNTTQSGNTNSTNASTANFDATVGTVSLGIGASALASSPLRGAFADVGIHTDVFRTKEYTDTKYAFADGETAWTFSAETITPITAEGSVTLDDVTGVSTGVSPIEGQSTSTLDDVVGTGTAELLATSSAAVTLDDVTGTATADGGATGTASVTLDDVIGSGSAVSPITAGGSVTLDDVIGEARGTGATVTTGQGAVALDDVTGQATAESRIAGLASSVLDDVIGLGEAISLISGSGSVTLDDVTGTATGGDPGAIPDVPAPLRRLKLFGGNIARKTIYGG